MDLAKNKEEQNELEKIMKIMIIDAEFTIFHKRFLHYITFFMPEPMGQSNFYDDEELERNGFIDPDYQSIIEIVDKLGSAKLKKENLMRFKEEIDIYFTTLENQVEIRNNLCKNKK